MTPELELLIKEFGWHSQDFATAMDSGVDIEEARTRRKGAYKALCREIEKLNEKINALEAHNKLLSKGPGNCFTGIPEPHAGFFIKGQDDV